MLTLPDYTTSKDCESISHGVVLLVGTTAWEGTEGRQYWFLIIFLLKSHMYNQPTYAMGWCKNSILDFDYGLDFGPQSEHYLGLHLINL